MDKGTIIVSNQIRCNKCGDEPFSMHRHDYVTCKCGSVAVDGGMSYLRRIGDIGSYNEMSITATKKCIDDCIEALTWAEETGRNKYGTVFAIFRALRSNGYDMNFNKEN